VFSQIELLAGIPAPRFAKHDLRYTLLATLLISASVVQLIEADMQPRRVERQEATSGGMLRQVYLLASWCTLGCKSGYLGATESRNYFSNLSRPERSK